MVGLDAAGKSTILYQLKYGESITTIPTVGFNVETVKYKNIYLNVWDIGGQDKIRQYWRHYYKDTQAIIFVVDSADHGRISDATSTSSPTAGDELWKILNEEELKESKLLVLANKQDLPNAMKAAELTDKLGLHSIKNRDWYIQGTCATSGDGLFDGLDWLTTQLKKADR